MDKFFDVLLVVLPSLIVFLTAYYTLKKFFDAESRKNMINSKVETRKQVLPIRLQAFERLAIYLERININTMVMRVHKKGMSARLLQSELLKAVREEFEHNVAQQIYVDPTTWQAIKSAKEETIKIINIAATKVNDDSTGLEFSKVLIEMAASLEKNPSDFGMEYLKKEIKTLF
jgi:hypothetical protein